jgi:hypothetical protein
MSGVRIRLAAAVVALAAGTVAVIVALTVLHTVLS